MITTTKFFAVSLTALPVLLYQGKQVRKHTPRLSPPVGKRTVSAPALHADDAKVFKLLVLGDSAAEGVGTEVQDDALLGHLTQRLSMVQPVAAQLIANTGDTIADILAHLKRKMAQGECIHAPDLVVISAGVNDVTTMTAIKQWRGRIEKLIAVLKNELQAKRIVFTAVPPMQHFTALPFPLNRWLGLRATMLNSALQKQLKRYDDVQYLTLDVPFDPKYIASDGFHPSAATYVLWAQAVLTRV